MERPNFGHIIIGIGLIILAAAILFSALILANKIDNAIDISLQIVEQLA